MRPEIQPFDTGELPVPSFVVHHGGAAGVAATPGVVVGAVPRSPVALTTADPTAADLAAALRQRQVGLYERVVKPVVDRVGGALLLVALSPVMLAIAVAVWTQLGRPILFRQQRVGRDGKPFGMYKFRSMRPDRRGQSRDHLEELEEIRDWDGIDRRVRHKSENDPRLVPIGRFLRRWSLDELPQLFNVVRGEMTLVGPRPELVAITERYEDWQHLRHLVKPGMTGLWQVSERGNGLMHEHTKVDLEYVARLSPATDLKILLLTLPCALGMHRGY